tara:strand:- start:9 stop:230 length:222 start_codon:yes stop_codon:yes gene_type:complete
MRITAILLVWLIILRYLVLKLGTVSLVAFGVAVVPVLKQVTYQLQAGHVAAVKVVPVPVAAVVALIQATKAEV